MKQPIKKKSLTKKKTIKPKQKWHHPKFGTSKLEEDFARDFLVKLGVKFVWQFEAKDIGRFYDFYLPEHNLLIEIDGGYYHADPRVIGENKLNPMQMRNKRIDEYKNRWALAHGIPIIRIWEKDIREKPIQVLNELKKILGLQETKMSLLENKNKRHNNKIK
jgi:very-short-patch-repair endonuclease